MFFIDNQKAARLRQMSVAAIALMLAACGGGGGGSDAPAAPSNTPVTGTPVKGPLVGATVAAYAFDAGDSEGIGQELSVGETGGTASIGGLTIPAGHSSPVVIEVTASAGTIDINSGGMPVMTRLLTIVSPSALAAPIFPSPLTTMAYKLALANADSTVSPYSGNGDGGVSDAEILSAFEAASRQVISAVGYGLEVQADLNMQPPLLTDATTTTSDQSAVARYRTAIEALSAVVEALRSEALGNNPGSTVDADGLLEALARDLTDGVIDGQVNGVAIAEFQDIPGLVARITADPGNLMVPGTSVPVSDVESLLIAERATTGQEGQGGELESGAASADSQPGRAEPDSDEDGVPDNSDNCPVVANGGQEDLDSDGVGDACDPDIDGDGTPNESDAFPRDPTEDTDTDGNGVGDNSDPDIDGDGIPNEDDEFPFDPDQGGDNGGGSGDSPAVWGEFNWDEAEWQ